MPGAGVLCLLFPKQDIPEKSDYDRNAISSLFTVSVGVLLAWVHIRRKA